MSSSFQVVSPVDGRVYVERPFATATEIESALQKARTAQASWRRVPIVERIAICQRAMEYMLARKDALGEELTWQMGRPIRYTPREIERMSERAFCMMGMAEEVLTDILPTPTAGFTRFIRREPLGVVLAISPWNYPYLTGVSVAVPAILAGNAVLLKHSPQTPLCSERMVEAFAAAGLPDGVFQYLHTAVEDTEKLIQCGDIDYVAFTGSVAVGRAVQRAAVERFIGIGLELGGKDPGYVRPDANLDHAIENLVDGAFFNSGQSCCAIERIYVHESVYDRFVEGAVELTKTYILDDPLKQETTLGPMVRTSSADFVRRQIAEAVAQGARALVDESLFPLSRPGTPYLAPQILVDVNHSMSVMRDESFGPVVGIQKVSSDEEALQLMNDTPFGLTAAIWSMDEEAGISLGNQLEVGTVFLNRCDYLDPSLAWVGVKESGRGCSLSRLGFEHLTRPKSFHLRTQL